MRASEDNPDQKIERGRKPELMRLYGPEPMGQEDAGHPGKKRPDAESQHFVLCNVDPDTFGKVLFRRQRSPGISDAGSFQTVHNDQTDKGYRQGEKIVGNGLLEIQP